jgi:hypothetical protein
LKTVRTKTFYVATTCSWQLGPTGQIAHRILKEVIFSKTFTK